MSEHLAGGSRSRVRREGNTVVRAQNAWSPPVIELLAHLERAGFQWSPRRVGTGFTPNGDEHLTFVPGQSPQPQPWSDEAIAQVGRMIRQLHTASSSFVLTDAAPTWNEWWGRSVGDASRGVGHGDLGPWNIMAVDGLPTGFIDWDTAGPLDPLWDLAYAAWLNVQLHDDDVAELAGLGDAAARAHQLAVFLDAYELPRSDRAGFVDMMVECAVRSARADAVEYEVGPNTATGIGADGYPVMWGIAWRVRSAAWMLEHRRLLERAW